VRGLERERERERERKRERERERKKNGKERSECTDRIATIIYIIVFARTLYKPNTSQMKAFVKSKLKIVSFKRTND
jgi:hypothetical protein